jgi:acyl carrier protein
VPSRFLAAGLARRSCHPRIKRVGTKQGKRGMSPADIRTAILDILGDILPDEDTSGLKDDVPLREQIELDSMDFLDIVMELRKRYRVQIPEDDYMHMATLGGTVKYLEPLMKDVPA